MGSTAVLPKTPSNQNSKNRPLSTKNRNGAPPRKKQNRGETTRTFFLKEKKFVAVQRGLSETHRRSNITHARARVASQWRANAPLRDHSKPQARIRYPLKSQARVSLSSPRSYPAGSLNDLPPSGLARGVTLPGNQFSSSGFPRLFTPFLFPFLTFAAFFSRGKVYLEVAGMKKKFYVFPPNVPDQKE